MAEPCYYCGDRHYEAIDVEACLRAALKREAIAYRCLAKSYEDLVKTHDLEHAMIERLVGIMKSPIAGAQDRLLEQLPAAEQLLTRHYSSKNPPPEQKG